ncbi:MAG TPA: hypothetical protein VGU25_16535 [Acidobacteriaceae bacterium]|nr:hypothetical protein [Acidobacteriaceae bacterium]
MATNDLHERNVAEIVQKANEFLGPILDESGTVLYSSCETLKPGKYYFLGLNPGGSEEGTTKIRQSLVDLDTSTLNAYLDESWCSDPDCKGCRPLQKSFKFLFEELGEDPYTVCASNLIFKRSRDEGDARYPELAELCWPVHEAILQVVQPHTIITFGDKTFRFVAKQLGGGSVQYFDSGHGNWACQSLIKKGSPSLIGLPHLSKYALYNHREVVEKIRSLIQIGPCPPTV